MNRRKFLTLTGLLALVPFVGRAKHNDDILTNKLNLICVKYNITFDVLFSALKRVGPTAKDLGLNDNQILSLIVTVYKKTARDGNFIGNCLKTILTRMERENLLCKFGNLFANISTFRTYREYCKLSGVRFCNILQILILDSFNKDSIYYECSKLLEGFDAGLKYFKKDLIF